MISGLGRFDMNLLYYIFFKTSSGSLDRFEDVAKAQDEIDAKNRRRIKLGLWLRQRLTMFQNM